ncbi:MAG: hypothetical protein HUU23_00235 [Caldilineales bacterium]|nr:hypothetical protein [Caldilineales bacterium]
MNLFRRLHGPLKAGVIAALLGMALAIIGILRGNVPLNLLSIFMALAISGLAWGVVTWAIATAACDVENDLEDA